jgi:hypothetical protein
MTHVTKAVATHKTTVNHMDTQLVMVQLPKTQGMQEQQGMKINPMQATVSTKK